MKIFLKFTQIIFCMTSIRSSILNLIQIFDCKQMFSTYFFNEYSFRWLDQPTIFVPRYSGFRWCMYYRKLKRKINKYLWRCLTYFLRDMYFTYTNQFEFYNALQTILNIRLFTSDFRWIWKKKRIPRKSFSTLTFWQEKKVHLQSFFHEC